MINIDTRLLGGESRVNEKEMWLLIHVAKRINLKNMCWPSNDLLLLETGWHIEKLQSVKKSLVKKGLIEIIRRGDKSNVYKIKTKFLGVFISCDDVDLPDQNVTIVGKSDTHTIVGKSDILGTGKTDNEVLANEVLTNLESTDSQKPLFTESDDLSNKLKTVGRIDRVTMTPKEIRAAAKPKREVDESYHDFKGEWEKQYPEILFNASSGAKINEIIKASRKIFEMEQKISTRESLLAFFQYVIAYVKRVHHFANGKPLTTFAQQYTSIVHEIKHGKQAATQTKPVSRFSKYH